MVNSTILGGKNSFSGTVARSLPLGKKWFGVVKGLFEKPYLINENIYLFGIIEAKTR